MAFEHLIDINDLTREDITHVLDVAASFAEVNERSIKKVPALRGKTVLNLFFEASTRTRTSFELAEKRLSCDTINFSASTSSVTKGETIADTIETLASMNIDAVVCRSRFAGTPQILMDHCDAKILNAGDGKHQHPTQALLDLFTIRKEFGSLDGLRVGIVGDILHSRVVGSLVPALQKMGAHVVLVGPPTIMPPRLDALGEGIEVSYNIDEVLPTLDVAYMLRIQLERVEGAPLPSLREYAMLYGMNARRASMLPKHAIVCHPGPMNRGVEITADVADGPRARVLTQVNSGVAVRMAALYLLLGGEAHGITA